MRALKPLAEQTIVITGASSGIGRATAVAAAERGANVVLAARSARALAALAEAIRRGGGRSLAVPTDVADGAQVKALADRAVETFGGIDTWVNNAGVSQYGRFDQFSDDEFRRVLDVNFFGTVYGARAALPYLEEQGRGALICVGSIVSERAVPLQAAYSASKHAVKAFTESLRVELTQAGSEVQVTLIKPSSINTPFFENAMTRMGVKPRPVPPVYQPELVANAILYAAEHRAREVTVGGGGKMLGVMETFAGPVIDRALVSVGAKSQQTDEPKPADGDNNLFLPTVTQDGVRGDFSARPFSVYTWLRLHPRLSIAALLALAAGSRVRMRRSSGSEL